MIVDLLFETFFGALTGYVTNDIAIKTLFKPGGTIEKTREQFTKEIAALLESEIITPQALSDILHRPEVTQELSKAIHSFLSNTMPSMIEDLTINDLDRGALAQYLTKETETLRTNQHFKEALSSSLKQSLTPEVANDVLNLLKQFTLLITEEDTGITFNPHTTILDAACLADAEKAFADFSAQFSENLLTNDPKMAEKIVDALNLSQIFNTLRDMLGSYSLSRYFLINPHDQASWRTFLTSFGNLDLVASLSQVFLENLKQSPLSLQQLLSLPPIKDMLLPVIEQQWPKISILLLQWLSHNKPLIVSLINETINEELSSQESLAPLLNKLVGELLGSKEEFSAEFLQKAHAFLLDNLTPEQLYAHLLQPLSPWSEYKISDIAAKIDPSRLKNVLLTVLPDILAQNKNVASFFTAPIAELLPDWPNAFAKISTEVWDKYITPQSLASVFSQLLWQQLKSFATIPLAEKCPNYLLKIQTLLADNLQKTDLKQASAAISEYLSEIILENLPTLGEKLTSLPLGKIYSSYFTEQKIQELLPDLTARCQELLLSAIPGHLAPLAERSLNNLSNDDMSSLVHDFMGKELKPLNYLGAAMGGTVGTAIGAVSSLAVFNSVNPLFPAAKLGIFGAVGYTTNCGAIKGLFWPYKPIANIRALQGIIPKRQTEFSQSLGHLFERYVLNPTSLTDLLHAEQENIQSSLSTSLLAAQTKISADSLSSAQSFICSSSAAAFAQITLKDLAKLFSPLKDKPLAFTDLSVLLPYYPHLCTLGVQKLPAYLTQAVESLLSKNISLKTLIPPHTLKILSEKKQHLSDEQMLSLAQKTSAAFAVLFTKNLNELKPGIAIKLFPYVSKFVPLFLDGLCQYLIIHLAELTHFFQNVVKTKLNILQSFAYAAVNGDQLLANFLKIFLEKKLPHFCQLKASELGTLSESYVDNFCQRTLKDNGLTVTADALYMLFSNKKISQSISALLNESTEQILSQPLNAFIKQTPCEGELLSLKEQFLSNIPHALDVCQPSLAFALKKTNIEPLAVSLKFSPAFKQELINNCRTLWHYRLKETADTPLVKLLPSLNQQQFLTMVWDNMLSSPAANNFSMQNILQKLQSYLADISPHLSALATELILAACPLYGNILEKMQLDEFIATQTAALSPEKLENMVRSFAQSYFTHIQNMGWWGAFFAIPGIVLTLLL